VPAGWSIFGGDPAAYNAGPRRREWVEGFFLMVHEVTQAEYAGFLDSEYVDIDTGRDFVPRYPNGRAMWIIGEDGAWHYVMTNRGPEDDQRRQPIDSITWNAAKAYCEWRSRQQGRRVRLPTEWEWERAARGADGRLRPWGDGFDWSFCAGFHSLPDPVLVHNSPIGSFTIDESPFGIRDMMGSRWEWCENPLAVGGLEARANRGGMDGGTDANHFRAAGRFWHQISDYTLNGGFRCVALPPK
jgi:serine/threonine-protein kinase